LLHQRGQIDEAARDLEFSADHDPQQAAKIPKPS